MLLAIASGVLGDKIDGAVNAYGASMFYVVTYALTTLASFGVIMLASSKGYEFDTLDDFKGLAKRRPDLAWVMLIVVFSLAGIPPTVGFYAKFAVLESAVAAGYVGLAIYAVMMSLIGAFFYLRIVKVMFFDEPLPRSDKPFHCPIQRTVLSVNGASLLVLGIIPGPMMAWCLDLIRASLAA
jgi:NADH-quinone oxidoreductase subunit N